jgi:hypothetical protein
MLPAIQIGLNQFWPYSLLDDVTVNSDVKHTLHSLDIHSEWACTAYTVEKTPGFSEMQQTKHYL